jgi:sterol desaturase/sphingolipid hydroxylase (fatty acid hydroxylase superfamily)
VQHDLTNWLARGADELVAALTALGDPGSLFFAPYLATFALIALAVLSWQAGGWRAAGGSRGLLGALFSRAVYGHPSARHDLGLYLLDRVLVALLFLPRFALSIGVAASVSAALSGALGPMKAPIAGPLAIALFTLFEVLVADLGLFLTHLLAHRVGLLWSFHKVHHSAPVLTPVTAKRFHPIEVFEDQLVMDLSAGVVIGVGHYLSGGALQVYAVLLINVVDLAWNLSGANLRHSHIWLSYPSWLSRILISPAMHQIHHSDDPRHHDKNLGNIFAVWDWIAGTLYIPKEREELSFGLGDAAPGHEGFAGLLICPFADASRWIAGLWPRGRGG